MVISEYETWPRWSRSGPATNDFRGEDLYPAVAQNGAALAHSLVGNHPIVDGNKRVGHSAREVFLILNGYEQSASEVEQGAIMLQLAASQLTRAEWTAWVESHVVTRKP